MFNMFGLVLFGRKKGKYSVSAKEIHPWCGLLEFRISMRLVPAKICDSHSGWILRMRFVLAKASGNWLSFLKAGPLSQRCHQQQEPEQESAVKNDAIAVQNASGLSKGCCCRLCPCLARYRDSWQTAPVDKMVENPLECAQSFTHTHTNTRLQMHLLRVLLRWFRTKILKKTYT